jgi:hypothetical protein
MLPCWLVWITGGNSPRRGGGLYQTPIYPQFTLRRKLLRPCAGKRGQNVDIHNGRFRTQMGVVGKRLIRQRFPELSPLFTDGGTRRLRRFAH